WRPRHSMASRSSWVRTASRSSSSTSDFITAQPSNAHCQAARHPARPAKISVSHATTYNRPRAAREWPTASKPGLYLDRQTLMNRQDKEAETMKLLPLEVRAFLDVFLHEATAPPFTGPATQALHQIGVEYGDVTYLAWGHEH